jgi:hypothetical protein
MKHRLALSLAVAPALTALMAVAGARAEQLGSLSR